MVASRMLCLGSAIMPMSKRQAAKRQAGILVAAGLAANYDTREAGIVAVDAQHPKCSLTYAPDTGTSSANYGDSKGC